MTLEQLDKFSIHFIIGPGRSGTTLLAMILNQHPNCISTPELKHFIYFYKKYKNIQFITEELLTDLEAYFDVVGATKKNILFNIEDNFYLKGLIVNQKISYAQLTKLIYLGFFSSVKNIEQVSCIVDKNPFYTFHTEKILDIFPDAKFITVIRDYRAFVLSNRQSQKPFISVKSVSYYAYAWNFHAEKLIQLQKKHPEKLLIINYENLVVNKETEVAKIFEFIKLPYTNAVFDFHKSLTEKLASMQPNNKAHARAIKKLTDLSKPINPDRVNAWKQNLSVFQQKNIEFICADLGNKIGYKAEKTINFFEKIIFTIIGIPGRLRVTIFYALNSIKIHHYLNEVRKANFEKKSSS